jgi:hypothetical protein
LFIGLFIRLFDSLVLFVGVFFFFLQDASVPVPFPRTSSVEALIAQRKAEIQQLDAQFYGQLQAQSPQQQSAGRRGNA